MAIIEAKHYEEARKLLRSDPIIKDMYDGKNGIKSLPLDRLQSSDGTPTFDFMMGANREYAQRGGTHQAHIGAVAEVLLEMMKAES